MGQTKRTLKEANYPIKTLNVTMIKKGMSKEASENRVVTKIGRITIQAKCKQLAERNVLISFATLKKFIKKLDREWRHNVTDFYVKTVTTIMSIIHFANFANKFIPTIKMKKMIQNGSDVISAKDGYAYFYLESYLM